MSRVYQTTIAIGASISKAFKGDAYAAAMGLSKVAGAAKQLKVAEKAAASIKILNATLGSSKARYNEAAEALRRLEAAEKSAGGATKESTQWRKAGEREVKKYAREIDQATKAIDKNALALRHLELTRFEASRERIFGARKEKGPLAQKAGEQLRGIAGDAMVLGTAAIGATAAMAGLVLKTLKAGDEIGDTADKLGITAKALQELRFGAAQSGAEVGDLDKAIAKMAINIGKHKIAKGKGGAGGMAIPGLQMFGDNKADAAAAVDPFKQIGLRAKDLAALKPEEQLKKIADGMKNLKTHAERAAVGSLIFGKGITGILPFLEEGSAGIDRMSKEANEFGGVLSNDAVDAADKADKAMKVAELAFAGLANTLGAALLPVATKTFKEFSVWVSSNRVQIKKWAEEASKWIEGKGIPAFKKTAHEAQEFAIKIGALISGAAKLTGGFGNLAIVVAGLRVAPLALTFGKIGVEGTKAAIAIFKYVAAQKAANALGAGGVPGIGAGAAAATGKAIGLAANASMLLGAGAIGFAIGSYLDDKFKISDSFEQAAHILTTKDADLNETDRATKKSTWSIVKGFVTGGGAGAIDAAKKAQSEFVQQKAAQLATSNRSAGVHVAPVIHIGTAATRDDVDKGMDAAKKAALDAYDKRKAHQKRVSFGQ